MRGALDRSSGGRGDGDQRVRLRHDLDGQAGLDEHDRRGRTVEHGIARPDRAEVGVARAHACVALEEEHETLLVVGRPLDLPTRRQAVDIEGRPLPARGCGVDVADETRVIRR